MPMDEAAAARILQTALDEHRAGELLDCLFAGGGATVGKDGLVLINADLVSQLAGGPDPDEG